MPADTARSPDSETADSANEIRRVLELQRRAFLARAFPTHDERINRLDRLSSMIEGFEKRFVEAVNDDFGNRSKYETLTSEIVTVIGAIKNARSNLKSWMRPRSVKTPIFLLPSKSRLIPQPLGVVGIISPWNYPLNLALSPASAALAAGNRVMIKPSELTPATSEVMREAVCAHFDESEMAVITGGVETGAAFSQTPFDHLLFTGSTAVGRRVAQAAAKNLTPTTLELGGKSPAIIDDSANLERAAGAIVSGKMMNAGQICIAPDYVLAPKAKLDETADLIVEAANALYPEIDTTDDYTSIISDKHYARLKGLIDDARDRGLKIVEVGSSNALASQRKLPLTLVIDPPADAALMQEEIFGPVLPILPNETTQSAIDKVNAGPRPLALYWFGDDDEAREQVLRNTHAGGVTVNGTIFHCAQENLPFGGVGESGQGAYHGKTGFETFTHLKPVFYQSRFSGGGALSPPYGPKTDKTLSLLRKII